MVHTNILMVSSSSYSDNGAARSLLNLASYASNAGNRVVVLLVRPGPIEADLKARGLEYHVVERRARWTVPANRTYPNGLRQRLRHVAHTIYDRLITDARIRRILDENEIDIVHINASTTCAAAAAAIRKKTKLVWHIREFMEEDLEKKFVDPRSALRLMSRADCVVGISDAICQKYADKISARMLRIYNGVDPKDFYVQREIFQTDLVQIVISGRVVPQKGQKTLLQALCLVKRAGLGNFACHILGPQGNKPYIAELTQYAADNDLARHVHFDGFSDRVWQSLRQMDILCLCSDKEAFGLSTVEGMLSGCLVIGSNTGGTAEIIHDEVTGLTYAHGDGGAEALAARLIWAMRHRERAREIAQSGQAHALAHFTSEITQRNIYQLYEDLLK